MPEKDLTKNLTKLIQRGDKLIRDVEKDIGEIMGAVSSVKATILELKNRIKKPDDGEPGGEA